MFGARSGRGLLPLWSVGARIHWPAFSRYSSEHCEDSQPLAAIHFAFGATPMPFLATMVPIVWVPWPLLSHGVLEVAQVPVGS
ncbi:hypothetical protein GCM10025734_04660 [Kitasatospora paranensis]